MGKTTVSTFVSNLKVRFDYNIMDTNLDSLIYAIINDNLRKMNTWFLDYGIMQEISGNTSFQMVTYQDWKDITKATIIGDTATFTGITGDKLNITIDGTVYADISIATCTTIALVVAAINTAVGSTVASEETNGYLQIDSLTTGASSAVTIADGTTTVQTVVGDLFSLSADRTASGITDLDEILKLSNRINDVIINVIRYTDLVDYQPDPTSSYSSYPDFFSRWNNYIYVRPTPSMGTRLYMDYIKMLTAVTSSSTLPFSDKYDPLLKVLCLEELYEWQDPSDTNRITIAKNNVKELYHELISGAANNIGTIQQTGSRRSVGIEGPRMVK